MIEKLKVNIGNFFGYAEGEQAIERITAKLNEVIEALNNIEHPRKVIKYKENEQ